MTRTEPLPEPLRSTIDVEVRYAETDQMGVVHHATYLVWFELARTDLCRRTGRGYHEIEEMGYWLMVVGAHLKCRAGARYGDVVQVSSWIERFRSRLLHFGYEARRDDEVLVTGITEHVWVDAATKRPIRIPEILRPSFERLAGFD